MSSEGCKTGTFTPLKMLKLAHCVLIPANWSPQMARDASWERFRPYLKEQMARAGLTSQQLADAIPLTSVTVEVVRKWRVGRKDPELAMMPAIATALRVDPADLVAHLGLLPRDNMKKVQANLAQRIVALQDQVQSLTTAESRGHARAAYGDLVLALTDNGSWAVAIEPA